ncbi:Transposase [Shigella dysenteriae 1617]|uniref:Transposase n=1 Tax=Shigella dysenteriae 1617 TaxID=754093 RepID=A0A0A6ZW89_SHIDY|nr:Transposase [Shigella dysenteriae 1617]
MAFNGAGVRDTARTLKIGINTVIRTLKNSGSYGREVPKDKHLTGKIFTQRIERNNLTLRTRIKRLARKTICFSRSVEIHEKVIGTFIEKHMFY